VTEVTEKISRAAGQFVAVESRDGLELGISPDLFDSQTGDLLGMSFNPLNECKREHWHQQTSLRAEKWRGLHQLYRPGVRSGPQKPMLARTEQDRNTARDGIGDKFASMVADQLLRHKLTAFFRKTFGARCIPLFGFRFYHPVETVQWGRCTG